MAVFLPLGYRPSKSAHTNEHRVVNSMSVQHETADRTWECVGWSLLHCDDRLHIGITDPIINDMMDPCKHPTEVQESGMDTVASI